MSLEIDEVGVAVTGELFVAPLGTAMPTDTSTALNAAFKGLGLFSEDGVGDTIEKDVEEITAWQNAQRVRNVVTSAKRTFTGTLLQTNVDVIETVYGTTVTQAAAHGTYTVSPGATSGRLAWVLEIVDGAEIKRLCIEDGEITEVGEKTYASAEADAYPITLEAYSDVDTIDTRLKS